MNKNNKRLTVNGIEYLLPTSTLIASTGLGQSELAARTCYDSYELSASPEIRSFGQGDREVNVEKVEDVDLLSRLVHGAHHESIIEHSVYTFFIENTSRGVLQEHARHRLQSISVRSTRYTMSELLYSFLIGYASNMRTVDVVSQLIDADQLFVTTDRAYNRLQLDDIVRKLSFQIGIIGVDAFTSLCLGKTNRELYNNGLSGTPEDMLQQLMSNPKKRNAGDAFKHIVNDNWSVSMTVTMNLRALKNYFKLRRSGAAYFQIQWLAESMWDVLPDLAKPLIYKKHKLAKA